MGQFLTKLKSGDLLQNMYSYLTQYMLINLNLKNQAEQNLQQAWIR